MTKFLRLWLVAFCMLGPIAATIAQTKTRKVLVIGIDGCVNSMFNQTNTPNIQNLINTGYYASNTLNENPTYSGPNWTTILTGTKVAKHGVTSNTWGPANLATYKSFFNAIKTQYPAKRTVSIVTYADLNIGNPVAVANQVIADADVDFKSFGTDHNGGIYTSSGFITSEGDADTKAKVVAELTNQNPDAIYCHFDNVDHTGHAGGFGPLNPNNVAAVAGIDVHVGDMLAAMHARPTYANEDWLIVVTTDHGSTYTPPAGQSSGVGSGGHGGTTYPERNSFIILNGTGITPTLINQLPAGFYNASAVSLRTQVYAQLPTMPTLDMTSGKSFTIQLRVKRGTGNGTDPAVIGNKNWDAGASSGFVLYDRYGKLGINLGDGTNRTDLPISSRGVLDITDGAWHNVSVVVDRTSSPGNIYLYDGGYLVASKAINSLTGSLASPYNFRLGQTYNSSGAEYGLYYNGNVTDVKIYSVALTKSQVAAYSADDNLSASTPNLVYYVKAHDGSGNSYVASVGNNATLAGTGIPSWNSTASQIASVATDAANYPIYGATATTFAILPSLTGAIDLGTTGSFTIELAVKRTSGSADPVIFGNKDWNSGANKGIAIVDNSGSLKINIGDGAGHRADINGPTLAVGVWHHISIVVNRSTQTMKLFDNGVLQGSAISIASVGALDPGTTFKIAQDGTAAYKVSSVVTTFNGGVKELKIFNTALPDATIAAQVFNTNVTNTHPNYADLTYYLKSTEGTGSTLNPVNTGSIGVVTSPTTIGGTAAWSSSSTAVGNTTTGTPETGSVFLPIDFDANTAAPRTYSIAPTVLNWLNVPIPSSYDGAVLAGGTNVLPIRLVSLTAVGNGGNVSLKWNVSLEINVDRYEIEKSTSNGVFTKLGETAAAKVSTYNFTDNYPANGVNLYRLKVVDKDGNFEYQGTAYVNFSLNGKSAVVSPNPVTTNEINISLKNYAAGKHDYTISDVAGNTAVKGQFDFNGNVVQTIRLNQTLANGVYVLSIINGSEKIQTKFIKQ